MGYCDHFIGQKLRLQKMSKVSKAMLVAQPGPTSHCPQSLCLSPSTVIVALRVVFSFSFILLLVYIITFKDIVVKKKKKGLERSIMNFCRWYQAHWPDLGRQATFLCIPLITVSGVEICPSGQGELQESFLFGKPHFSRGCLNNNYALCSCKNKIC